MSDASGAISASPPAGLDRRFYAFAIDRLVAWPIIGLAIYLGYRWSFDAGDAWPGLLAVVGVVLSLWLVSGVFHGIFGTSPGKAAMGLRVVRAEDGRPIGFGPALLRALVLGIAALPTFGFGIATLAQTAVMDPGRQRRGWHDQLAGSIVVDVRPPEMSLASATDDAPRQVVNLTAMRLAPTPPQPPMPAPPRRAPATAPQPPVQPPVAPPPGMPGIPPATPVTPPTAPVPQVPPAPEVTMPRQAWGVPDESERTVVRGARPPAPVAASWRVTFDTGETFLVEGLGLVGRRPEGRPGEPVRHLVPLASEDLSISKTHAQFQIAADGVLVVMDRGSTNGSTLVRSGVARGLPPGKPTTVLSGDLVRFGDRSMTVVREA